MDDISEKLSEILKDPDSLNRVREMAESILGNNNNNVNDNDNNNNNSKKPEPMTSGNMGSLFGNDFDPVQIGKIISIMSRLKADCDDNRTKLLLALKPHLSEPRREKIDTAVKLLKLFDLLPLLRESGMFEF